MNAGQVDVLAVMARCSTTLTCLSATQPVDAELAEMGRDLVTARVAVAALIGERDWLHAAMSELIEAADSALDVRETVYAREAFDRLTAALAKVRP